MRMGTPIVVLAVCGGLLMSLPTSAALAGPCVATAVEARGEQSRFLWLAKTKARANWRAKVRSNPGTGAAYANWARAQNTVERCLTGPAGTVCIFTGTPCLP